MHLLPGQQGLPGVPQVAQTPPEYVLLQIKPLPRHTLVEVVPDVAVVLQQVSPGLFPHRAQTPDTHFVPAAVHAVPVEVLVPVVQQGLPGPPQAPVLQDPALHVPARGRHEPPSATQILETQQPLLRQVFPEQQIFPGSPHVAELLVDPPDPPLPAPPEPDPPLLVPPAPAPAVGVVPPAPVPAVGVVPPAPVIPPLSTPPDELPPDPPLPSPPVPVTEVSPPVPPVGSKLLDPLQP